MRTKKVFSSSNQVIHLWANQSQDSARCKNVFFEGKTIWSYGRHYELGRLTTYNNVPVALINSTGYSVTTAKHISWAYSAVSHMFRVKVDETFNVFDGLLKEQNTLINNIMSYFSRRKFWHESYLNDKQYYITDIKEFNNTCTKLGHPELTIDLSQDWFELLNEHVSNCLKKEELKNTPEAIEERRVKALKKAQKDIDAWRIGGPLVNSVRNLKPMLLRVMTRIDNGEQDVQTSGGAVVPLSDALKLYELIEADQAKQGDKVGSFKLDNVQGDTVKIGCHTISLREAKNVLGSLKGDK